MEPVRREVSSVGRIVVPAAGAPWLVLIADDDPRAHRAMRDALAGARLLDRAVELVGVERLEQLDEVANIADRARLAVAVVGMKEQAAAVAVIGKLREYFGSPLQIALRSDVIAEDLAERCEISAHLPRGDVPAAQLRAHLTLCIRNFRLVIAMRSLCDDLNDFVALSARGETLQGLDEQLRRVLDQNSQVWQFEYLLVPDLAHRDDGALEGPWQRDVVTRLRALAGDRQGRAGFTLLSRDADASREIWGCVVQPLGGHVQTGFALRQADRPNDMLRRDLRVLLRSWALTRESVELKQIAQQQRAIRDEMLRDRRESIARMVADVAHDVKTPLGVANTAAGMLASVVGNEHFERLRADPELAEELEDIREAATLAQRNVERAGELINNFHRLSVGQIVDRCEELDLLRAVQDIVALWAPEARRSQIKVRVHDELAPEAGTWLGYLGHLSQVLLNLLSNAQRYAYPEGGGTVDVYVRSRLASDRPEFTLEVRDHGAGIPTENLPHIFDPFFTTGSSRGGTGLGLAILHNLVTTAFGGTIRCESEVGRGTTFTLRFVDCAAQVTTDRAAPTTRKHPELDALEKFIELQRKVATGEALSAEEQSRLAEVRASVEPYLIAHSGGGDRRGAVRVVIRRMATISIDGETASAEIRDISMSGAMLLYHRRVGPGSRVSIMSADALKVHGEAVSCAQAPRTDGAPARWQLGVRFADLDDDERHGLEALVAQLLLEGLGVDMAGQRHDI